MRNKSLNNQTVWFFSWRGLCDLLDTRPGGSAAGRPPLHELQCREIKTLAAAPGCAQLRHEPLHLLLQGWGNVANFQEPPALHRKWHAAAALDEGQCQATQFWSGHWQQSASIRGDKKGWSGHTQDLKPVDSTCVQLWLDVPYENTDLSWLEREGTPSSPVGFRGSWN